MQGLMMGVVLSCCVVFVSDLSRVAVAESNCHGGIVRGLILDSSGALVPDASVTLDDKTRTESKSDGQFAFSCVDSGSHVILVAATGFGTQKTTFVSPRAELLRISMTVSDVETSIEVGPNDSSVEDLESLQGKALQSLADDPDDLLRELQQIGAAGGGAPSNTIISVDGFQDSTHLPPKTSIASIRVNPNMYSAEYAQPPYNGGRVEVYTKPGQDLLHGALFVTNSSTFLNAQDPFSVTKSAVSKERYGFEFSGPIRKAGSDFALALEHRSINNVAVVDAIALNAAGAPERISSSVPIPQRLWMSTARSDWQVNPTNTVLLSYSGKVNNLMNVGVGGTSLAETGYSSELYDHSARFTLTTTRGPRLIQEARVSLRWDGETDVPTSTAPQLQIAGALIEGGASIGAQQLHELRIEADDDVVLATKAHTLKLGVQTFNNIEHDQETTGFNGTYLFGGGVAPVLDSSGGPIVGEVTTITGIEQYRRSLLALPGGNPTSFSNVTGDPQLRFSQTSAGLFIQDDWTIRPHLHIAGGIRYYLQNRPLLLNGLTPRLGVTWSPSNNDRLSFHAYVGLFTSDVGPEDVSRILREDGRSRITRTLYNPVFGTPFIGTVPIYSVRTFDSRLSNVTYVSWNVGTSYAFAHSWSVSVNATRGRTWNDVRSDNINAPFGTSPFGARPATSDLNVLQVQNSGQGIFGVETISIAQPAAKRLHFSAGITHVREVNDTDDNLTFTPQNSRSDAGEFAQRTGVPEYKIYSNATLNLPGKFQLSEAVYSAGRARFNITTGFDNNGDGDFNDRPEYALLSTPNAMETHFGLLTASGGATVFPRNRGIMPWTTYVDANIQRTFQIGHDSKATNHQNLTVNIRSSNLLNHTNITAVGGVLGSPLFDVPYAGDNGRRVEIGARYSF